MKLLTADEKAYLRLAYEKGFRYVATNKSKRTFFYSRKPIEELDFWRAGGAASLRSLVNFGTSWEDGKPTEILDILTSNKCKLKKFMSDNTKRYIVDLCNYIDWCFSIAFIVFLIRCIWYTGYGWEYALGSFVGVLFFPAKKYWAEWLGIE